ncbi:MAG TPA: DNA-directed RNA polymerase subunit D [Thermoplasmata archaeon]|nr:DNA-directed RNA polymerase subunit D [Thermoplasmata archaeon]
MKVEITDLSDEEMELVVDEANPYFVNTLRRILTEEIPQMAIEDVIVYDNTSALFDEIITHRLCLLPLPWDDRFRFRDKCSCKGEGCSNCTLHYTLSKEGPCTIYSRDLIPEIPDYAVVDPSIPIVELKEEQRLILEAEAMVGQGREHAKWQAVSRASYKYYPEIQIDNKKCDDCKQCVDACPNNCLGLENGKIFVKDLRSCSLCKACVEACESGAITVNGSDQKFIFNFETNGNIKAKDALLKAVELLDEKYKEFAKKLSKTV